MVMLLEFGMEQHQSIRLATLALASFRQSIASLDQVLLAYTWEFLTISSSHLQGPFTHIDSRLNQETFESLDSFIQQLAQISGVARYNTTPESNIAVCAHLFRLLSLDIQVLNCRSGWD